MLMPSAMPMAAPMTYPAPAFAPADNRPPAVPASAPRAAAPAPAPRRPLVRAQAPDEPMPTPARPARLTMPSPEQLGVAIRPDASGPDWSALHARMKQLGVVSFHMDSLPDGRARFTCWVPGGQPGLTQRIEALAATPAEAVRLGLERAAQSRGMRP